jgi:alpha-ketoglutarate-dependent 2,4-dichlorophenoxyacetate dioxygenase
MAWKNPTNGRNALYIASHAYAIEGIERAVAQKLLAELMDAATAPGLSYVHTWRKGDVVMWDNRATLHRGRPAGARGSAHGAHTSPRRGRRSASVPAVTASGGVAALLDCLDP